MVRATGEIQDLLTDKSRDDIIGNVEWNIFGANDFEEWTVIDDYVQSSHLYQLLPQSLRQ